MPGPLHQQARVLDLSERSPAAAIAGMVLADLGAEVIRVEPVGGDPVRALAGSRVWLRGQQSVTIDAAQVRDGSWRALRDSADVIIDTAQPWLAKPRGLIDDLLADSALPSRQIVAVLTAYPRLVNEIEPAGSGANYPVCGELVEAQYGMQNFQQGVRPEGPHFLGWPHAIYGAAWMLQIGILGALYERAHSGTGQTVTTSLLDGAAILSNVRWLGGERMGPSLLTGSRITTRPSNLRLVVGLFECADGCWIQVHTGPRGAFDRMLKVVGREDLIVANAGVHILATPLAPAVAQDLWGYLDRFFKTQPSDHWCDVLARADVCCMPALKPGEALWLEQMEKNGLVDIAPDGSRMLGKLAKYGRTPLGLRREVPAPGQHQRLLEEGRPSVAIATAPAPANGTNGASTRRVGPLDGLLVLDFGAYMAGPFANRLFADLGARVIKVEEYGGDPMRGPQLSSFLGVQRGKESIAVDLKSAAGRQIALDLVRRADVVHHNLRAGAMERLGIGWEQLQAINPRLIFCHSSGYGNDGPWAKLPTFEPLHSALTGMLVRTGGAGNMPDHYLTHMDYGCGLTSCTMVLAALLERERSGLGQYLEVPQTGAGLFAMSDVHGMRADKSETFPLDREQRGHSPANALYRTADGWIVIACYSDREWLGVRRALGIETAWPEFAVARRERFDRSAAAQTVAAALGQLATLSAVRRLRAENVPCTVPTPFSAAEIVSEPTMRARGVIVTEDHFAAGAVTEVGHTVRFSRANSWNLRPAPVTGQHSVAILRELGRDDAAIAALVESKVINVPPAAPASAARPVATRPA